MATMPLAENELMKRELDAEENSILLYGSTPAQIKEETEYVKKIRTTLEKIRNQIFKDDIGSVATNHKLDSKSPTQTFQNGYESDTDNGFSSRYYRIIEKLKDKELQLLEINRENEDLQIKLEATREAGAQALRNASRKLYENYHRRAEELRKKHDEQNIIIKSSAKEQEQRFKESIDSLNDVADRVQEKHIKITDMENLIKRMEEEKKILVERKLSVENQLRTNMSTSENINGWDALRLEYCTLQEQIYHLQKVMMAQHQLLRNVIQEIEDLNNELQKQDETIDHLQEKIQTLEAQNKDLKQNVANWSSNQKFKMSKGVSANESAFEIMSPYMMLLSLRKKKS